MLLDDLKAKCAQKRSNNNENITEFISLPEDPEPYILFDSALSKLAVLAPRSYQVALLHYFLGYDIEDIGVELTLGKSSVYNELSTAKAYLRTQC
jgi:DNA-directed RNA polymerase specialized sigma24 family protein